MKNKTYFQLLILGKKIQNNYKFVLTNIRFFAIPADSFGSTSLLQRLNAVDAKLSSRRRCYPRTESRFKCLTVNINSSFNLKLTENHDQKPKRRDLTLDEVLDIVKQAWIVENKNQIFEEIMDDKIDPKPTSPVFLRRRLSAPETIMRKYSLTQQRSSSWDNNYRKNEDNKKQNFSEINSGSDPFLNRNKKSSCMRKSTLLRRFFCSIKQLPDTDFKNFGSCESKCYQTRNCQSTSSLNDFKELNRTQNQNSLTSFKSEKAIPKKSLNTDKQRNHHIDSQLKNDIISTASSSNSNIPSRYQDKFSTKPKRFKNSWDTSYAGTSPLENSDSALTKTSVTVTESSSNNSFYSFRLPECNKKLQNTEDTKFYSSILSSTNKSSHKTLNTNKEQRNPANEVIESSTQTNDTSNLNVISNVQLSQSTLEAIFTHVLRDVQSIKPSTCTSTINATPAYYSVPIKNESNEINAKTIQVKQFPVFNINPENNINIPKTKERDKFFLTNLEFGNVQKDLTDDVSRPSISRYSAFPFSSSMDVNYSSEENLTDKDSDVVSIPDSLEEQSISKIRKKMKDYNSNTEDCSPLLPDNSTKSYLSKPASFFVSIGASKDSQELKSVAELLPQKLKDKLSKRQLTRSQRQKKSKKYYTSSKSDSNYVSASENGKVIYYHERHNSLNDNLSSNTSSLPKINLGRKKGKTELPSIDFKKRNRIINKTRKNSGSNREMGALDHDLQLSSLHSRTSSSKSDLKVEQVTKRIEILHIVECVENSSSKQTKSKIPVMVSPKMSKTVDEHFSKADQKPLFLSSSLQNNQDSKVDQLIANILIDALNKNDPYSNIQSPSTSRVVKTTYKLETLPASVSSVTTKSNEKYKQTFAAIPEEKSFTSLSKEGSTDNMSLNKDHNLNFTSSEIVKDCNTSYGISKISENYKGKAAIAGMKDDNFTSIPKGWITFYMLHKCPDSPDSTSDEGTKSDKKKSENYYMNNRPQISTRMENDEKISFNRKQIFQEYEDKFEDSKQINSIDCLRKNSNVQDSKLNDKEPDFVQENKNSWSLTLSGSRGCDNLPHLQMHINLSNNLCKTCHRNCTCSKSVSEESVNNNSIPKFPSLTEKQRNHSPEKNDVESRGLKLLQLPKIFDKQKWKAKNNKEKFLGEPRQTKTSTFRKLLHRKSNTNTLQIYDSCVNRLYEVLKVNGNSITPRKKYDFVSILPSKCKL